MISITVTKLENIVDSYVRRLNYINIQMIPVPLIFGTSVATFYIQEFYYKVNQRKIKLSRQQTHSWILKFINTEFNTHNPYCEVIEIHYNYDSKLIQNSLLDKIYDLLLLNPFELKLK